jgi:enoyl-CoA hydratase
MADGARIGMPLSRIGLVVPFPLGLKLVEIIGPAATRELLFTGRLIDADAAKTVGLVSRVVPHDELLPTAMALAQEIAANPPLAVQRLKAGLRRALDPDWDDLGRWVSASLGELFQTEDHKEGVRAFLEKRDASYVGR